MNARLVSVGVTIAVSMVCILFVSTYNNNRDENLSDQGYSEIENEELKANRPDDSLPMVKVVNKLASLRQENWPGQREWIHNFPFRKIESPANESFDRDYYAVIERKIKDDGLNGLTPEEYAYYLRLTDHVFLLDYYNNPSRFSKAYMKVCKILWEKGRGDTIIQTAHAFNALHFYHLEEDRQRRITGMYGAGEQYISSKELNKKSLAGAITDFDSLDDGDNPEAIERESKEVFSLAERLISYTSPEDFRENKEGSLFMYDLYLLKDVEDGTVLLVDLPLDLESADLPSFDF